MPPPRIPASLDPTTVFSANSLPKPSSSSALSQESIILTSASASFAQLSLFSPSNLSYESPTQILHNHFNCPGVLSSKSHYGEVYFVDHLRRRRGPPLNTNDVRISKMGRSRTRNQTLAIHRILDEIGGTLLTSHWVISIEVR